MVTYITSAVNSIRVGSYRDKRDVDNWHCTVSMYHYTVSWIDGVTTETQKSMGQLLGPDNPMVNCVISLLTRDWKNCKC